MYKPELNRLIMYKPELNAGQNKQISKIINSTIHTKTINEEMCIMQMQITFQDIIIIIIIIMI